MVISSLGLFSAVVDDPPKHYPLTRQRHKAPSATFVVVSAWGSIRTPLSSTWCCWASGALAKRALLFWTLWGHTGNWGRGGGGRAKACLFCHVELCSLQFLQTGGARSLACVLWCLPGVLWVGRGRAQGHQVKSRGTGIYREPMGTPLAI